MKEKDDPAAQWPPTNVSSTNPYHQHLNNLSNPTFRGWNVSTFSLMLDETMSDWGTLSKESSRYTDSSTLNDLPMPAIAWDSETDPDNPMNWSQARRIPMSSTVCFVGFVAAFTSAAFVAGTPGALRQFGHPNATMVGTLTTSLYLLGFGLGPFWLAPLSEVYGRKPVLVATMIAFTILQVACAVAPTLSGLIVLRFLAGCAGSLAPALGPASLADLYGAKDRIRWISILTIAVLGGAPFGNFLSAFVISSKPWPWIFWTTTILASVCTLLCIVILRESYEPVILRTRAARRLKALQRQLGEDSIELDKIMSELDLTMFERPPLKRVLKQATSRPLRFILTNPVCDIIGVFAAYVYGMLYLILVSLPLLFGKQNHGLFSYKFAPEGLGLSYLGLLLGFLIGGLFQVWFQGWVWEKLKARNNGETRPEYRLVSTSLGLSLFPVGLLLYGWSAQAKAPWIVPQIGLTILAIGVSISFQSLLQYIAEAFTPYSASAVAATTLLRSLAAAGFPFFGQIMFEHINYGPSGTILGLAAIPAIPVPWYLYKRGVYLREKYAFKE